MQVERTDARTAEWGGETTPAGANHTFWWIAFAARLREASRAQTA